MVWGLGLLGLGFRAFGATRKHAGLKQGSCLLAESLLVYKMGRYSFRGLAFLGFRVYRV